MPTKQNLNDKSLLDLFLMETAQQCLILNQQMSLVTTANSSSQRHDSEHTQLDYGEIHRALHSTKGAARIVDLRPIVQLTQALEDALRPNPDLSADNHDLWQTIIAGIDELNKFSVLTAEQLRPAIKQDKNIIANIINRLVPCNAPETAPQQRSYAKEADQEKILSPPSQEIPPTKTDISHELFDIFQEDIKGHLAVLINDIIELEKNPHDSFLLEESMRAAHSIKGAARIIELHDVVKLAHAIEDVLVNLQNNNSSLTLTAVDNLLAGCDLLNELTSINVSKLEFWFTQSCTEITRIINLLGSPVPDSPQSSNDHIRDHAISNDSPPAAAKTTRKKSDPKIRDRNIRVSAKNMNQLMGLAGEAIVEAEWLPLLMKKTTRLKIKQNEIWAEISNIHKRLLDKGMPAYLEDSFSYLNRRIQYCQEFINSYISEVDDHVRNATNISHRLQHEVIANRMQPFSEGIKGLPRLIRDLSRRQKKKIRLEIEGEDIQIDRDIMEKLEAPLTHIVTNAIDHGVESPAVREKAGKPSEATIKIAAKHLSGLLYITISDDGNGVNFEALRQKISSDNLVAEKSAGDLQESELLEFLFLPNFSTKASLSESSGRGVGLDVVHNIIRQVRGNIEVSSEEGYGSYFKLCLPLTLSIIRSIVAEINNEPYAFPLVNIDHVVRLSREQLKEMEGRQYIISHNKRIGIIPAQQALELEYHEPDADDLSIIVLENANTPYGLIVDHLQGIRDLVVQPLTPKLGKLRSINAAAIAEDGTPILILDIQDLIMSMDHLISGNRLRHIDIDIPNKSRRYGKRILVVDDSVTVREVERSLLTKHGFGVDVAADGIDAWNLIKKGKYDLVITDVDMPQMDGIELLCQIRESQDFEELPVIIVSYKDREEDKNRGLNAGADYYLTKGSFSDRSLIEAVEDLIGSPEKLL